MNKHKFFTAAAVFLFSIGSTAHVSAQIPTGYKLETVQLPKGAVTILGLCHKPDGTLAVASWEGEVWEYKDKKWTRFAENLMEPNGIYYDEKEAAYYVAQKPELTRLVDTNKDGICDRYECVTNAFGISGEYHEYHFGPVVDSLGRKYASLNLGARGEFTVPDGKEPGKGGGNMSYNAPWRGWVYRSDRTGHFQPLASGFRSPCGIGMSPNDELFITDNQGDWVADCCLYHVREGNFYGHPASLPARPDFTKEKVLSMTAAEFDKIRTGPAIWFPREVISNSPGSPIWDTTGGKFGPFENQMFIGDQTQSNYFRCGVETVNGDLQGWCVDFLRGTASGPVKMSFDPQGRLWSAQVGRGWYSKGGKRTALQYAEWDGKTVPFAIKSASLTKTGFKVEFTRPVENEVTPSVKSWHYHYYSTYGSPPVDEKVLEATNYTLSKDRKTVTFDTSLTAGKIYALKFADQKSSEDASLDFDTIYYTLNKLRPAKEPRAGRNVGWSLAGSGWNRNDKRRPTPPVVEPLPLKDCVLPAPKSATELDASQWTNPDWKFDAEGVMARTKGNNETKESYGNARIHLEFRFDPGDDPEWTGQLYGNSGLFLMSGYELQVVNSYQNPTFADGTCGSIYGQHPPRVNACRKPGEWQSYDILMKAPEFAEDGSVAEPLRVTIFHNGILIHDDAWVYGEVGGPYKRHGKLPLKIQDHKGTGVSFRNLWIVPDVDYDQSLPAFRGNFGNTPRHFVKAKPEVPRITILSPGMVSDMDTNRDNSITIEEFVEYRAVQFDPADKDNNKFLDAQEFPHPGSFRGGDKNKDGKLSREEHLDIFRGQFPNVDVNKDGVITADDKRNSPAVKKKSARTLKKADPAKSWLVNHLEAGKKQTVVTFGTSLTAVGAWVDQLATVLEQQYPGQCNVINGAQGGANSDWGRKSLDDRVLQHNPDTVLIEFSVNDAVARRKTSVEHARGNLENMLDRILAQNPDCEMILQVMNPAAGHCLTQRPNLEAYNQMYRDVAKERGLQLIDHYPVWGKLLKEDPLRFFRYMPDSIHPLREGALNVILPTTVRALGLDSKKPELSQDEPCWKYLLHMMEKDRDGKVTREEYNTYWRTLFDKCDINQDGQLKSTEFQPEILFQALDSDQDGKILPEEYLAPMASLFTQRDTDNDQSISKDQKPGPNQAAAPPAPVKNGARPAKPNIVFILTDDLGWQDVGCYDIDEPTPMETPHIDALAKRGVQFWQGYSPAPTCAPTRCAIMSGNHPARAQKTHVVGGTPPAPHNSTRSRMMSPWYTGRMPENEVTLPKLLRKNGYVTGHCGKWHMAIDHNAFPRAKDQGFDWTRSNLGSTRKMQPHRLTGFATNKPEDPFRLDENGYPFHQNSEDALEFVRESSDNPFFLYYATWLVHTPIHTRSKALLEKYSKKLGVTLDENDPESWKGEGQTNPFYCAMVEELDYHMGRLFRHLDETDDPRWPGHKLVDNTYIIFTSDNGGMERVPGQIITDNYPLDRGKISAMEGGTRVPFIVTGPGIAAGVESDVMVNGLDLYPTILSLTGTEKPADKRLDGCDISPLLHGKPTDASLVRELDGSVRDTMVWHFPNSVALESTIRVGDYKLIRNYDHVNNTHSPGIELFQLYDSPGGRMKRVDIEEAKNLADSMPEKAAELNGRLTKILTEMAASYPYYNPYFKGPLPNKDKVCSVLSHQQNGNQAEFTYQENGAKVTRANLLFTKNGGHKSEEWFRIPARIVRGNKVIAELPEGTTHYLITLIDENQFLRSYPEVRELRKKDKSYSKEALPVNLTVDTDNSAAKAAPVMVKTKEPKNP